MFNLVTKIIISLYYRKTVVKLYFFPKESHEKRLDVFANEINKREKIIDSAIKITDIAVQTNSQENRKKS